MCGEKNACEWIPANATEEVALKHLVKATRMNGGQFYMQPNVTPNKQRNMKSSISLEAFSEMEVDEKTKKQRQAWYKQPSLWPDLWNKAAEYYRDQIITMSPNGATSGRLNA